MRHVYFFIVLLFSGGIAAAQDTLWAQYNRDDIPFITIRSKQAESIYSIARKYSVPPGFLSDLNDKSLKEAIEQMLQVYKLRRRFDETSLVPAWPELMGKAIANRTKQLYVRDRRLYIRVESSVIKNELMMMRSKIIEKMNEYAGSRVIDEVILL